MGYLLATRLESTQAEFEYLLIVSNRKHLYRLARGRFGNYRFDALGYRFNKLSYGDYRDAGG